ncbi:MAG: hypothetical protein ACMUIA_02005 [bacterium]
MAHLEHLLAPIFLVLLGITLWEIGRSILKKMLPGKHTPEPVQNPKQRILYEKEKLVRDIRHEASTIMGQGHFIGMLAKDRILKETRQEAHRVLQEAKREIEKIRSEAIHMFQKDMADAACMVNQQLQRKFMEYVCGCARTTPGVINKYLDNQSHQTKKEPQISKLL